MSGENKLAMLKNGAKVLGVFNCDKLIITTAWQARLAPTKKGNHMGKNAISAGMILSLALVASQSAAMTTTYSITDLGTNLYPVAINNNGQVVGSVATDDGHSQAFVYEKGVVTGLGTFGGTDSVAVGMNITGSIAGNVTTNSGASHGFLYKGAFNDLFGTAGIIRATGINNSDAVLGVIKGSYWGNSQAVLYDNGLLTNISVMDGDYDYGLSSDPIAINNVGQAVYFQWVCGDCENSYLYSNGTVKEYVWFVAADLNDSGDLVGHRRSWSWDQNELGLWYHDGEETILNDVPGKDNYPQAINNKRQIVGTVLYDDATHAFVYSDSTLAELNSFISPDSGWDLVEATDIDDNGAIIGYGRFQGDWHAYLLEPRQKVELQVISHVKDTEPVDSKRLVRFALMGSSDFDAATVNPETIKVAGAAVKTVGQKQRSLTDLKDINNDGLQDLALRVPMGELVLDGTSGRIALEAETFDGHKVYAETTFVAVP